MNGLESPSFPGGERREEFAPIIDESIFEGVGPEEVRPGGVIRVVKNADPYASLRAVLDEAFAHASRGKGQERHGDEAAFEHQVTCEIRRRVGPGYTKGQAVKKIYESDRLLGQHGDAELLGAINYIAAEIIVRREGRAPQGGLPEFVREQAGL